MSARCNFYLLLVVICFTACTPRVRERTAPPPHAPSPPVTVHEGRPYDIVTAKSLLVILVYRGGTLARLGHNHVIASHDLTGRVFIPVDITRASFEVRIPVAGFTVDEADLRAAEGAEFPPGIPDSAKQGTRHNMLGPAVLDASHFPGILLQSEGIETVPGGLRVHVRVTIRDQVRSLIVPMQYRIEGDELRGSGNLTLRQSDFGIRPFSTLAGALRVKDELRVRFNIVAHSHI